MAEKIQGEVEGSGGNVVAFPGGRATRSPREADYARMTAREAARALLIVKRNPDSFLDWLKIGVLFETQPELDAVVGAMWRNGYVRVGDLHIARLEQVFLGAPADARKRQRVLDCLRNQA